MPAHTSPFESLRVQQAGNQLTIAVPWRHAEGLQTRLREQGIRSTLYFEPWSQDARLEPWPGADAQKVQEILDSLHQTRNPGGEPPSA